MNRTLVLLLLAACGLPAPEKSQPLTVREQIHADGPCEVAEGRGADELFATAQGVLLGQKGTVQRFAGAGCHLTPDGTAPIAVSAVLAADDLGNVYAYPRQDHERGVVSTLLRDESETSMIAKIDRDGHVSKFLATGRGIWGFGVSPQGGSVWFVGCGPSGVHSIRDDGLTALYENPPTLWGQTEAVLTDDQTFFSTGFRKCATPDLGRQCGYDLMRTTAEGTTSVGTTIFDVEFSFEYAQLAACGTRVCGRLSDSVVVWDSDGTQLGRLSHAALGVHDGERVVRVTGNAAGLYLLLRSPEGTRVVFSPVTP